MFYSDHKEISNSLDWEGNEQKRSIALRNLCAQLKDELRSAEPHTLATKAALAIRSLGEGQYMLSGDHYNTAYNFLWPQGVISRADQKPVALNVEALWLHYLNRADGTPLTGRWVNLSEIGGLFYQQAFQGYCGDELAKRWGDELEGLRNSCLATGGWPLKSPGDFACEWRVLPRLPLCLCYRLPTENRPAWATMLFDAAADHYVAADVAAIVAKALADQLNPL